MSDILKDFVFHFGGLVLVVWCAGKFIDYLRKIFGKVI